MTNNGKNVNVILSRLLIIFIIILLLMGCNTTPVLSPILTNPPCPSPCWENIYPGKTSKQEVLTILKNLPTVDLDSITTRGESWKIFNDAIYSTFQSGHTKAEIYFIDDKVSLVILSKNLNITFDQATKELGEPENVINIPLWGGVPLASTSSSAIIALSPKQGISFSYDTRDLPENLRSEIKPENIVSIVTFFDPELYDKLMDAGIFSMGLLKGNDTRNYMKPWTGYGKINEKYPSATIP